MKTDLRTPKVSGRTGMYRVALDIYATACSIIEPRLCGTLGDNEPQRVYPTKLVVYVDAL